MAQCRSMVGGVRTQRGARGLLGRGAPQQPVVVWACAHGHAAMAGSAEARLAIGCVRTRRGAPPGTDVTAAHSSALALRVPASESCAQASALRIGAAAPPRRQALLQGANAHALQEDLAVNWGG